MPRNAVGALAVAIGFAVWLVPMAANGTEPWDASLGLYCLAMALAGAACMTLASPRRSSDSMRWPGFIVLGEFLYLLFQPDRWSLLPLALIALVVMAAPAMLGAWLAERALHQRGAQARRRANAPTHAPTHAPAGQVGHSGDGQPERMDGRHG